MNTQISISRSTARWIALGVGVVSLIVGLLLLVIGPLSTGETVTTLRTISYVAFALAAIGLVGFVLIDPQALSDAVTGRSGLYGITTWIMVFFFTVFIIAMFIIVRKLAIPPWDLTEAQKYAMSDTTRDMLRDLNDDIEVVGFYADDDPDRAEAEIWLKQYETTSNGRITHQFIDPDKNPGLAQQAGMSRSSSMLFKRGDQSAEASAATEEAMTNALLQVMSGEARVAYIVSGNGEGSVDDFNESGLSQLQSLLTNANFTVSQLNMLQATAIPDDADVVLVVGPKTSYLPKEVETLNAYSDKGGSLLIMIDALGLTNDDPLIKNIQDRYGIIIHDDIAVDSLTAQLVGDPITPLIYTFDETSPITQGMNAAGQHVFMTTARSFAIPQPNPDNVQITPLMLTSAQGGSYGENNFTDEQPALRNNPDRDIQGPLIVGISAENAQDKSRIVVFGDSDMATNAFLNAREDNGDMIINTVNWLTHKEDLISLPQATDIGERTLSKLNSIPVLILLGVGTFCLIPLIMFGSGIVVWAVRRRRR